jgi:polysaccharide biosynthesis protein PslE
MRQEIESAAMQNEMESKQGSLRDFLYVFFRRKFLLISSALVILVIGLLGTMSIPVVYKARADILVKPGAGELTSVDSTLLDSKSIIHDDSLMRSEAAILESQPVSAAVVETLGVDYVLGLGEETHSHASKTGWIGKLEAIKGKVYAKISAYLPVMATETVPVGPDKMRARAVARVQHGLEIERRDNFITLYYRYSSPEKAQVILGEIIKEYRKRRSQVYAVKPDDFRKETESVHTELVGKENELQSYLSTLNISSLEDDRKLLLEQLSGIESEIQKADVIIGASETQLTAWEGLHMEHPNQLIAAKVMTQDPVVQAYSDRLVTLQLSAIELLSKYPRDSQPVRDVEKQISTLQTLISSQIDSRDTENNETAGLVPSSTIDSSTVPNPLTLARISLDSQRTRRNILVEQRGVIKERLSDLSSHELALSRLKRDVGVLEKSYLEYCTNLRQAEIQAALNNESISNVSLVQAPTLPGDPNRTIQTLVLAFTLIGALFGSITLVLIFNHMDHSIHTPLDLENRLQLKTLASIPLTSKAEIDGRLTALSAKPVSFFSGLGKSDPIPTPEHAYILGKEIS